MTKMGSKHTGERICEIAEDKEARAVMVSAHRKSMLTEFLLGSTTNYLTHSCKRPVVVLHGPRGEVCHPSAATKL